jgi:group I intron endonuclease
MFIYKIFSEKGDKVYIGSTRKKYLSNRWACHRSKYRLKQGGHCASYELFDEYGMENCKIQLLEECDESIRYERERHWIQATPHCVNIVKNSNLTREEKRAYHTEWRKKWMVEKVDEYKERMRKDYLKQKPKMSAKVMCECGIEYTQNHHQRHRETLRHKERMENGPKEIIRTECECGMLLAKRTNVKKHQASLRHKELMKNKSIQ